MYQNCFEVDIEVQTVQITKEVEEGSDPELGC